MLQLSNTSQSTLGTRNLEELRQSGGVFDGQPNLSLRATASTRTDKASWALMMSSGCAYSFVRLIESNHWSDVKVDDGFSFGKNRDRFVCTSSGLSEISDDE